MNGINVCWHNHNSLLNYPMVIVQLTTYTEFVKIDLGTIPAKYIIGERQGTSVTSSGQRISPIL